MSNEEIIEKVMMSKQHYLLSGEVGASKTRGVFKWIDEYYRARGCRGRMDIDLENLIKTRFVYVGFSYSILLEKRNELINDETMMFNEEDICIVGHNDVKEEHYTVGKKIINKNCKIIMITQSSLQKCNHKSLYFGENYDLNDAREIYKSIKSIIVDEIDFRKAMIPTMAYAINSASYYGADFDFNRCAKWINYVFSPVDHAKFNIYKKTKNIHDKYFKAEWLEGKQVVAITTEKVQSRVFTDCLLFNEAKLESKEFKHHTIHMEVVPNLNTQFYDVMNKKHLWKSLFDLGFTKVYSNKVKTYYENEMSQNIKNITVESLDRFQQIQQGVRTHMELKGSNDDMGKKVLTVISKMNDVVFNETILVLRTYDDMYEDAIVSNLVWCELYEDLIRQCVGRVIGYRGEYKNCKDTYVFINKFIYERLRTHLEAFLPFTINICDLGWEEKEAVCSVSKGVTAKNELEKEYEEKIISDFIVTEDSKDFILCSDLKRYIKDNNLKTSVVSTMTATSIGEILFGKEVKAVCKKIDGKQTRVIRGIRFKGETK